MRSVFFANRRRESAVHAVVAAWRADSNAKSLVESLEPIWRQYGARNFLQAARRSGLSDEFPLTKDDWEGVLESDTSIGLFNLGVSVWRVDGEEELALCVLREAADAGAPGAEGVLGEGLYWLERFDEARVRLERSVHTRDGVWRRSAGLLGELYWVVDGDASESVVELLSTGASEWEDFALPLSEVLRERGEYQEAARVLRRAIEHGDDTAAISLGNLLWDEIGDLRGAEQAYEKGIQMGDSHSAFNLHLLLEQEGRTEASGAALEKAAAMGDERALIELRRRNDQRK